MPPFDRLLTLAVFATAYVGLGLGRLGRLPGLRVGSHRRRLGLPPVSSPAVAARLADPGHGLHPRRQPDLIGSVANLIVVEAARAARIEVGSLEYCRLGVPLTLVTLAIGCLVLVLVPV